MEQRVTTIIESGDTVDLVFPDVSKAFDLVNYCCVIQKLKAYGINDNIVNRIDSFLHERTFTVSIKWNEFQSKAAANSAAQGPMPGPFLFVVYVNDVSEIFQWNVLLFADDEKYISARANFDDLQRDLKACMGLGFGLGFSFERE